MTALAAHRDQCAAAAAQGEPRAAERLERAESWIAMLRLADTPEIGELFMIFAEENR